MENYNQRSFHAKSIEDGNLSLARQIFSTQF